MTAISRDQGEAVLNRLTELKDAATNNLITTAEQLHDISLPRITTSNLLSKGYDEFTTAVHKEYDGTSFIDLAELLVPSFKRYFFTGDLKVQIAQIIINKTR